ncbi:Ribosome-associated protein Y (PSrp-1) [Caenispirillum salinarum AK4]|uniref:Ribosome-associated protein Y (PSrp-1) n=1 Tax=Caenispirillum salinarum AK4 TaxID=1238182 RepID=K9H499_9PROT|nr:HPF/RaiA family ribosome-associated protein [Caenispirillum salinarum]EKV31914.1 Ribosome-associated protein Y (PSrp-1) [Caenispirillum salinarum AK4]
MQVPVQISFHGLEHSDAVEERVREKVAKLEQFSKDLVSCRVVIEQHHKNTSNQHHKGEPYHITINLSVPGDELVVKRDPKDPHVHEDIGVAIRDAFQSMEQQLKTWIGKQRENDRTAHKSA